MLTYLLTSLIDIYSLIIVVYVLMSWIPQMNGWINDLYTALGKICDPYLDIFKKVIPPAGAIDFSPVVAIIALMVVSRLISILI